MNEYEMKQEAKRERLERAAERASRESARRLQGAHEKLDMIPSGQPILIGHHSEKRHRRHIEKIDNDFRRGFEANRRAAELQSRAAAVGTGGISSDDPDAVEKLTEKLAKMEQKQALMKAVNAAIRKSAKRDHADRVAALEAVGLTTAQAEAALAPDYAGRIGFPSYALQNNNANIRRVRQRIEALSKQDRTADVTSREVAGATITRDPGENRVFLRFPARLSHEAYKTVRAFGFVWNRSAQAFSRQLNGRSEWAAEAAAQAVARTDSEKGA